MLFLTRLSGGFYWLSSTINNVLGKKMFILFINTYQMPTQTLFLSLIVLQKCNANEVAPIADARNEHFPLSTSIEKCKFLLLFM